MHLNILLKNKPSSELLFVRRVIAVLLQKININELEGTDIDLQINEHYTITDQMGWLMEVMPQPKQNRTT
jgi:hypothetical protein